MVELHHGLRVSGAVDFDVFFQALDDQVVVCVVLLLHVCGMSVANVREWHFG